MSDENRLATAGSTDRALSMRFPFPQDRYSKDGKRLLGVGAKDADKKPIHSVTVREISDIDMTKAALLSDANKTSFLHERLAISVVAVNDGPLINGVSGWNNVALDFLLKAFNRLNATPDEIAEELLDQGEVLPAK